MDAYLALLLIICIVVFVYLLINAFIHVNTWFPVAISGSAILLSEGAEAIAETSTDNKQLQYINSIPAMSASQISQAIAVQAATNVDINVPTITAAQVVGSGEAQYDEYDNQKLLLDKSKLLSTTKNIVIDGNNLLYAMMQHELGKKDPSKYMTYLFKSIELCHTLFPNKNVFYVIKSVENIDFSKYATGKLRVVVTKGDAKAQDDHGAIYLTELLNLEHTILLSRDRYRDIHNIASSDPLHYTIYGKNTSKYEKLLKKNTNLFKIMGNWSFKYNLVGYSFVAKDETSSTLYNRKKNKSSVASELVLLIYSPSTAASATMLS